MSYFVEVQAVRSEVGSLVHEAAIFRSDTEVLDDIEIDAATVHERGFGLLVDAGIYPLRIIGWTEHQRSSANPYSFTIHSPYRASCVPYLIGPSSSVQPLDSGQESKTRELIVNCRIRRHVSRNRTFTPFAIQNQTT